MDTRKKVMEAIWAYQSCPPDALATMRFTYTLRPDPRPGDETHERFAERALAELYCDPDLIRDDDGYILVEESIQHNIEEIDELFYYEHIAGFTRTMNRTKKIKEELMMATWHPRRIERLLELGGHEALDNFAGV